MKNNPLRFLLLILFIVLFTFQVAIAETIDLQESQQRKDYLRSNNLDFYELTFSDLGITEPIPLQGPYQAETLKFSLPPDWEVEGPVTLKIDLISEFQSLMEAFTAGEISEGLSYKKGYLKVELNGTSIGEIEINDSLQTTLLFTASTSLFNQDTLENELVIAWDSSIACNYSIMTIVSIDPHSTLEIPFTYKDIDLRLNDFPAPFYFAHNFDPYPMAIVLPEEPDENDLSALIAVSAGLGKLTNGNITFEILRANELRENIHRDFHLVFLGTMDEINTLIIEKMSGEPIDFPDKIIGTENGFLTYHPSPWNSGRVILIITGENGNSLIKSSTVISAENILPFSDGNEAVIVEVSDPLTATQLQIDHKLGEFLYEEKLHAATFDETIVEIPFAVPGDLQISHESYLELYFRHSQLINYLQSGISIYINESLVGTVRFSDHTAENGLVRIILPPNVIQPLNNKIKISFFIVPQDLCADERSGNYWITIYGDSYLHLPPILDTSDGIKTYTLDNLSSALLSDGSLSNLIFVANHENFRNWEFASSIAYSLGKFTNANIIQPSAQFLTSLDGFENNKNYILIGKTDDISEFGGINRVLPIPFEAGGEFDEEYFDGIQYEIDVMQEIGILETTNLPEQQLTILGVFGNSIEGLASAFDALIEKIEFDSGENANIEIIDSEKEHHYFLIEQDHSLGGEEDFEGNGWLEQISNLFFDQAAIVLLIGFVIITIIFTAFAFKNKLKD